jgi:hypothetical protein
MLKTVWTVMATGMLAVGIAGCGGGSSLSEDYCKKLDSCNALSGTSVSQCTEDVNKSLDTMTSSQRSDFEKAAKVCLDMANCTNFLVCDSNLAVP